MPEQRFTSFTAFYPYYLSEHTHPVSRRLHFTGTSIAFVLVLTALLTANYGLVLLALVQGYALAWVGHYFYEHNRPATFKYPLYSFMGDWRMWADILTGRLKL